jgi:hypothetical protein
MGESGRTRRPDGARRPVAIASIADARASAADREPAPIWTSGLANS